MITPLVAGRALHDIYSGNGKLYLRMKDGRTIRCAWGDHGPELVDVVQLLPPTDQALEPRFQYVSGKTVKHVLTDGERMLVVFTDGHELQVNHERPDPEGDAVHVRIMLPAPPPLFADAGSM